MVQHSSIFNATLERAYKYRRVRLIKNTVNSIIRAHVGKEVSLNNECMHATCYALYT